MAGYVPAEMVLTPWGDAASLRAGMLSPGAKVGAGEVARSQRGRLFGAMVATVAEKGYEATTVGDLVALSGVSRSTFYRHFEDKQACFLAAVEALVEPTIAAVARSDAHPDGEAGARRLFDSFIGLVVAQAAASRMCFVEIYAAGPEAVEAVDRASAAFERFVAETLEQMPGRAGMPPGIVRAITGGLHKVIHTRLYRGTEAELAELAPQLWQWGLAYLPPPRPLRTGRRRRAGPPPERGRSPVERLLRALAATVVQKGYPEVTVADVVAAASTSQSTFYENFANKEEAMIAAVDAGSAQMLAATLPAFRRAPDWPAAVRAAFEAMFDFGLAEPEFTQLGAVEVYSAGKRVLEQRDRVMEGMQALLEPGFERAPAMPPVAAEAIGGAIYALIYDQVKRGGPQSLPALTPLATYVALCPFLGAEEACEVANAPRLRLPRAPVRD